MIRKLIGKLQCLTGYHNWSASMQDYIDEWGYVPFDNRIASKSKCSRCGEPYIKIPFIKGTYIKEHYIEESTKETNKQI